MKRMLVLAATFAMLAGAAYSAEPILGNWKTEVGTTAAIASCGSGYCITLKTGKHAGERIGTFSGKGGSYAGKITDPDAKKTYNGVMTVSGDTVTMKGCVMKVFCQSQTWTRL
jgi:uncharacterized protein (DUF2147 family)